MALESIVRPAVITDPSPKPKAAPAIRQPDNQPFEITSSGGSAINLTHSESISWSRETTSERREDAPAGNAGSGQPRTMGRTFDIIRVYRVKEPHEVGDKNAFGHETGPPDPVTGETPFDPRVPRDERYIDRTQYIDTEVITRLDMVNEKGDHEVMIFKRQEDLPFNMTYMAKDVFRAG